MSPYANPEDQRASDGRRYLRNRAERLLKGWEQKLRRVYGITVAQYEARLEWQGFACAICRRPASDFQRRLHVDHTVIDGKVVVRGLLCFNCNSGLGKFFDNGDLLRTAATYLGMHRGPWL